ncbi:MAG: hypothetical protein ACLUL3_09560 [Romboutsia timonensis]|jgi:hypothetical protein|uniref:hypothetical protein n=1 Tax=Romboutsia timonensis TaxID=1776391 RepID=UPI0039920A4D
MIILGHGVFSIGGKDIAITRGGGQFAIEREYRDIEADGDRGPVKNRTVIDKSVPKLTMNALSMLPEDFTNYYPGMTSETTERSTKVTGKTDISEDDYKIVKWTGKTKQGKGVIITLKNAINLENLDWTLQDKDEVIQSLTYVGTYAEDDMENEPWDVEFIK